MSSQREGRGVKRFFKAKGGQETARVQSPASALGTWGGKSAVNGEGRRSRSLGHSKSEKLLSSLMGSSNTASLLASSSSKMIAVKGRKGKDVPPLRRVSRCDSDTHSTEELKREPSPKRKAGRRTPRELVKRAGVSKAGQKRRPSTANARHDVSRQELQMSGALRMRYSAASQEKSMDFALFWCTFRHPCLFRFVREEDKAPIGATMVSPEVQVEQQGSNFTLSYPTGERYEFKADAMDSATLWTIVLRKAIAASANPSSAFTRTLSKTGLKDKGKKLSKSQLTPRARLYAKMPLFASACADLSFVLGQYDFSPTFMARQEDDGFFHVQSGKVTDLVAWFLIHCNHDMKANRDFSSFLLSFHRYCTPEDFVAAVKKVWSSKLRHFPYGIDARLVNFLRQYLLSPNVSLSAESDAAAKKELFKFCSSAVSGPYLQTVFGMRDLLKALGTSPRVDKSYGSAQMVGAGADRRILQITSSELVQLLTELDEQIVAKVSVTEFLDQRWQKSPERAPNLVALASNFNKTSCWVAHSILSQETTKERVRIFSKFVRVAKQLMDICNYQTCAAVISGLKCRAVERLKGLQEELKIRYTDRLEKLALKLSPDKNYAEYRSLPTGPPCIPFLAVYLRDLTFIDEGNKWFINTNKTVCNFVKADLMASCLRSIKLDKTAQFCFECDEELLADLAVLTMQAPSEEELFQSSICIEPFRSPTPQPLTEESSADEEDRDTVAKLEQRVAELEAERRMKMQTAADLVSSYRIASGAYAAEDVSPRSLLLSMTKEELIDLVQEVLSWESTEVIKVARSGSAQDLGSSTGSLGCDSDEDDEGHHSPPTRRYRSREELGRVDVRKGLAPARKSALSSSGGTLGTEVTWNAVEEKPIGRKLRVTPRKRATDV